MTKQDIKTCLVYDGYWQDVTSDVFTSEGITVIRGQGDESSSFRPSRVSLTFNDKTGKYNPRNPLSPLYGKVGRNTPVVVGYPVLSWGFETATPPFTISSGSSAAAWARTTSYFHSGAYSLKSGAIANSQFSDAIITAPAWATSCTLMYKVSSAAGDNLRISTGGNLRLATSGTVGWTQVTVPIVPNSLGAREVFIRYIKDAATTAGDDAAYIDDVFFWNARGVVEASAWSPDHTIDFNATTGKGRATVEVTAEGILRRIGQWTEPLRSPMYRTLNKLTTILGYWPMEDSRNATQLTNAAGTGISGSASGVTFASDESPGGSDPLVELDLVSELTGRFAAASATAGWQVSWSMKLAAIPGSATYYPMFSWTTTNGYMWVFEVSSTAYRITVTSPAAVVLLTSPVLHGVGQEPNRWITFVVKVSLSGGTVTVSPSWYAEGNASQVGITDTFSGSIGALVGWSIQGNVHLDNGVVGHVYGVTTVADDLLSDAAKNAINGYSGETAGARFLRLCAEEGVPTTIAGASNTQAMGAQKSDTFMTLLEEIAATDDALIYDTRGHVGLSMRARRNRYNQTPALALTYGTNVAPPLTEVIDDLDTHNRVTVKQRDGGEATATRLTGPLSVLPSPDGVGEYKQTIDVNVDNETRLPLIAGWWLSKGTVNRSRYPTVTVDLDANPTLAAQASAVDIGDRITIDGYEADQIGLMVIGTKETIGSHRRLITFTCAPDQVWMTGVYDGTTRRADSASTTLNAGYSSSATSMVFTTVNPKDVWSTTNLPYDVTVAGERIRVTAMTAPTGTGPYLQTATVTRAINSIPKSQVAGAEVHVFNPARYAF